MSTKSAFLKIPGFRILLVAMLMIAIAPQIEITGCNSGLALAGQSESGVPLDASAQNGILVFSSPDGQFRWWLDGRIYLDTAFYMEDKNTLTDGFQLRRGRFAVKSILYYDWYVEFDLDFAEEATEVKDAYVRYDNLLGRTAYIRFGNFREPFGLEENTTSRYLMFMERSQGTDALVPGRRFGIEFAKWTPRFRMAVGVFGQDVEDFEKPEDEGFNVTGRFNFTPVTGGDQTILLGLSASQRQTAWDAGKVRFKTRPETHVNEEKFLDTGTINGVDDFRLLGGELAWVRDRLLVQGEFMHAKLNRSEDLVDLGFSGGYGYVAFFLTDDSHPYENSNAEFGKVVPSGKNGALELALRFSKGDLSNGDVLGGTSQSWTLGLNWYANPSIKLYTNFVLVDNDEDATGKATELVGDDNFSMIQFRLLATF
jgi:phosphate-selective porin OprO and OprP